MDIYTPDSSVPQRLSKESIDRRKRHAKRQAEAFLKGPIPLAWLRQAANLKRPALTVGLALWFQHGITNCHDVRLTHGLLRRLGLQPWSGLRGLHQLIDDGLVEADIQRGRTPIVTLPDCQVHSDSGGKP